MAPLPSSGFMINKKKSFDVKTLISIRQVRYAKISSLWM